MYNFEKMVQNDLNDKHFSDKLFLDEVMIVLHEFDANLKHTTLTVLVIFVHLSKLYLVACAWFC